MNERDLEKKYAIEWVGENAKDYCFMPDMLLAFAKDNEARKLASELPMHGGSESLEDGDTVTHVVNRVVEVVCVYEDRQTARVRWGGDIYEVDLDELIRD